MAWRIALALALVWWCSWHGEDWGPFRTLTDCQDYNRATFHHEGFCHFEF